MESRYIIPSAKHCKQKNKIPSKQLRNDLQHTRMILSIPPHAAAYIECVSTDRTPQAYIEDPEQDLDREAVAKATASLFYSISQSKP